MSRHFIRFNLVLVSVMVALIGCATDPSSKVLKEFPELRPTDGGKSALKWNKQDGDDFMVFYAEVTGDASAGAGIYQGGSPRFRVPKNVEPIKGKLGVFDVDWYPMPDKDSKFYRTCLIDYQKANIQRGQKTVTYTNKRHVWVYSETEEGLNAVVADLDKLTMFSAHPSDIVK